MKNLFLKLLILFPLLASCKVNVDSDKKATSTSKITFACWNVQTFFDAEMDGVEYDDFRNYSKWSKEKYLLRLENLCQVMTTLNADVFVFEEIENTSVVQDISNQLVGKNWAKKNNWNYAAFTKNEGDAIGCAVFSKFPLENLKVHNLDIKTQNVEQPRMRPIFEMSVAIGERDLTVFVNHWKSKSGGEKETEIWRDWQELVCQREVRKSEKGYSVGGNFSCILCGDFNRDVNDFTKAKNASSNAHYKANILFRGMNDSLEVFSPWYTENGNIIEGVGSYYYKNEWSRIDNIFCYGNVKISGFASKSDGIWANEKGIPIEYKIYNGNGFSDHLPIMCVLLI